MKNRGFPYIFIYILPLFPLLYSNPVFPETTLNRMVIGDTLESIEISSDNGFEIDNKRHVVTFIGNVEAVKNDMNMKCQRIELFYEEFSDNNDTGEGRLKILEIIAEEDVRVSRSDGGTATAEKAVYNQKDEKVVLTGNPIVKQGTNVLEGGCRITLFLKEERIVVEPCGEKRARALVTPNEENR
ncbi:MAG TPA: LptA/OstA family protein [Desulfatiglandales bacterium]|nr:LptA/OstA family protein [Desulfatiglandales bacterium]